eukprot:UN24875
MFMEYFLDIINDQWLNRLFQEIPVTNRTLILKCIDSFVTRLLRRQYESLASNARNEYVCPELHACLPSLFQFFNNALVHWPLDYLHEVQLIINLWLKFITPWKLTKPRGQILDSRSSSEKRKQEELAQLKTWKYFIDNTLPFYTILLKNVLRLAQNFDFSSQKSTDLLTKVLRAYTDPLVMGIKNRAKLLFERSGTSYSVRLEQMMNSIQAATERDIHDFIHRSLIFNNQEITVIAQQLAEEFADCQKPQVKSPTKGYSVFGFLSGPRTPKRNGKTRFTRNLNDHPVIKNLKRLFKIETPTRQIQRQDKDFLNASTTEDGYLDTTGIQQVLRGTHTCPPLIDDIRDVDLWDMPTYSWEFDNLVQIAYYIDSVVFRQKIFRLNKTDWREHQLYGKIRI